MRDRRLRRRQALAALGAWIVYRVIAHRVGLAYLPRLMGPVPWILPLLNNSMVVLVITGTALVDRPFALAATAVASLLMSTAHGLVLYWAGRRFGSELARRAEGGRGLWSGVWNPRRVEQAHRWLERYGPVAIAGARATEVPNAPVMLVAGSARMSFWKFIASHTAGAAVFAAGSLWLGGRAARAWPWLPDRIEGLSGWSTGTALLLLALLAAAALLDRRKVRSRSPDAPSRQA